MSVQSIARFLKMESSGGLFLMSAAVLALVVSNSFLSGAYAGFLNTKVALIFGDLVLDKPLLLWINDGLMAIFFLLVGLELKREVLTGHLSQSGQIILPVIGAVGGFFIPAAIYTALNWGNPAALNGWAISSATDIAFALGVLALLGDRCPLVLKVFLASLAIIDDLAAIVTIALFYSGDLSEVSLGVAALGGLVLLLMNRLGVVRIAPYLIVGLFIWFFVLKSGVHATLAGVLVALAIPLRGTGKRTSPLHRLEHNLHPWVAFAILPLFAFANAGVDLRPLEWSDMFNNVSMGIILGLFAGKQLGVFGTVWLAVRFGWVRLPADVNWTMVYGVSILTGIGFTMSLFIGSLAFERGSFDYTDATRIGVLAGSVLSATMGYAILRFGLRQRSEYRVNEPPKLLTHQP